MKIIDIHTHTEFSLDRLIRIHKTFKKLELSKETFLKQVKDTNTEYVFSIGQKDGKLRPFFKALHSTNIENLVQERYDYPFLKRIMAVNLDKGSNHDAMREYLEHNLLEGIKIYLGYNIKDLENKKLEPYYELAKTFNKPILIHTGDCFPAKYNVLANPKEITNTLDKYPNQKFVLCHLGYPKIEKLSKIIQDYDNAYTDVSGLMTFHDILIKKEMKPRLKKVKPVLKKLLNNENTRSKIMYGTDYPLVQPKHYLAITKQIIPKKYQEQIFYDNAKTFFSL